MIILVIFFSSEHNSGCDVVAMVHEDQDNVEKLNIVTTIN